MMNTLDNAICVAVAWYAEHLKNSRLTWKCCAVHKPSKFAFVTAIVAATEWATFARSAGMWKNAHRKSNGKKRLKFVSSIWILLCWPINVRRIAKLQPYIVFIDEIDSFLRSPPKPPPWWRHHSWCCEMDWLITMAGSTIIIIGATNRPTDLDHVILRRMPAQSLGEIKQQLSWLWLTCLCRNTFVYRLREYVRKNYDHCSKKWMDFDRYSLATIHFKCSIDFWSETLERKHRMPHVFSFNFIFIAQWRIWVQCSVYHLQMIVNCEFQAENTY